MQHKFKTLLKRSLLVATLATGSFAAQAAPVNLWQFEGNANDSTGALNGVLNGPTAGYSPNTPAALGGGQSLELNAGNATTDFFSAIPTSTISGSYTVAAWVNVRNQATAVNSNYFSTRIPGETSFDAKLGTTPQGVQNIHGDIGSGAGWLNTAADVQPFNYNTNQWYHVTYAVTPAGYDIYVDGAHMANGALPGPAPLLYDANHHVRIGEYNTGVESFNGNIDDVAVWDGVLDAPQVAALANGMDPMLLTANVPLPPPPANNIGAVRYIPITGDADSGISASKTYTHKLDFGTFGVANINGVQFDQGDANANNASYSSNIPNPHPGGQDAFLPIPNTDASFNLFRDMTYGNDNGEVVLKGLTPGQAYDTRFYMRQWGPNSNRTQQFGFDIDNDNTPDKTVRANEDDARANGAAHAPGFATDTQPYALSYNFIATDSEMTIDITRIGSAGSTFHLYGLTNEETNLVPIDTLFSTGLDADGHALPGGTPDPHYTLISGISGTEALAITNHPAWNANTETAGYLGVLEPGTESHPVGNFTYETSFSLDGYIPSTAQITMTISVDNEVTDILLNGISTGIFAAGHNALDSDTFVIDSGFKWGNNTLTFITENVAAPGPAGLRVEMTGNARLISVPEPASLGMILVGSLALLRRRKK